jgi:hypothetical protein
VLITGGLKASDLLPTLSAVPMAVMTAIATVSTSYHDTSTYSLQATLTVDNSLQAEGCERGIKQNKVATSAGSGGIIH